MADDTKPQDEEVVDQPQDEAQEEVQEEQPETEAPEAVETPAEDEPEQPEQPEEEPEGEPEQPPSRREQLRIQQLLQKYGPPQERQAPKDNGVNFRDMIDAEDDTYQQLEQSTQQYGEQKYNAGLEEAKFLSWRTDLKIETPQVYKDHPELDPKNKDGFNPALADSLNKMYLGAAGYDGKRVTNPDISYRDYIDSVYEMIDEAAAERTRNSQRNITKQAARTGIRPDGSTAKRLDLTKDPTAMSDEELDALGATLGLNPKKR